MSRLPRISVVTPSYNQGRFLARTIESVLAQDYADVEHIVVDGMSTDETPDVLARYSHLRVIREPDRGQADAINKGFRLAHGDILCFLNSDDTLLPGALMRVANAIDPARGRHVVMGRCIYTDENDVPTGLEHPSEYESHDRILKVWKGHCVPQPATFWTAEAWRRCGPMDVREQLALDYDLICRFSRHYRFHEIDQVLATYRLHAESKSCANAKEKIIETAIRVSRRHWGSPLGLQYWRLWASLACYRLEQRYGLHRWSGTLLARSYAEKSRGQWLGAVAHFAAAAALAPLTTARRWLIQSGIRQRPRPSGLTRAYRQFTGVYPGGLVGPTWTTTLEIQPEHRTLLIDGVRVLPWLPLATDLVVALNGRIVARHRAIGSKEFTIEVALTEVAPGACQLRVDASPVVVPHDYIGTDDWRPLGFRLRQVRLETSTACATRPAA